MLEKRRNILQVMTDDYSKEMDENGVSGNNKRNEELLQKNSTGESESDKAETEADIFAKNSLFVFGEGNSFRNYVQRIVIKKSFVMVINIIIVLNCIFLVFETIDSLKQVNDYTNILFTIIFTIEMIMKVISYGFVLGENTYLRDPWNWLDFVIVVTGLVGLMPDHDSNILALRTFRLIRPLKTISMLPNMRVFISTLINSLIDLSTVFLLLLFFFFIFAILGLSIWNDRFDYICRKTLYPVNGTFPIDEKFSQFLCGGEMTCGDNSSYCLSAKDAYFNGSFFLDPEHKLEEEINSKHFNYGFTNFNNIVNSLFVVFQTTTSEGWSDIMYMMMDGHNYYIAFIFFILCVIVNYFLLLNLLVAVLLYNFEKNRGWDDPRRYLQMPNSKEKNKRQDNKDTNSKLSNFNNLQNEEISHKKYRRKYVPIKDSDTSKAVDVQRLTSLLHKFTKTQWFEHVKMTSEYHQKFTFAYYCHYVYKQPIVQYFFYACIIINSITLCFNRFDESEGEYATLEKLNIFMVSIFTLEIFLLLAGKGLFKFTRDIMNIWDFLIVSISLVEIIILKNVMTSRTSATSIASIFRMMRVMRIFKLIRSWQNFQVIMSSIKETLIRMADFFVLLALFLFIFTLLGCTFFKNSLKFDPTTNRYSPDAPSNAYNFDDFPSSLISVFLILIGDQWDKMFFDCLRSEKNSSAETILFFIFLVLIGQITMLKIFLAYLIDNFERARKHLHKNIKVKTFIENVIYYCSRQHEYETNDQSKINQISVYNFYLQKLENKKLLSEGRFIISAKSELDFFLFKKKKAEFYDKKRENKKGDPFERIIFFDELFMNDKNKNKKKLDVSDLMEYYDFDIYYEKRLEENDRIAKIFEGKDLERNEEEVEDLERNEEDLERNEENNEEYTASVRKSNLVKGDFIYDMQGVSDHIGGERSNSKISSLDIFNKKVVKRNDDKISESDQKTATKNVMQMEQARTFVMELSRKKIEKLQTNHAFKESEKTILPAVTYKNGSFLLDLSQGTEKNNKKKNSEILYDKTRTFESFGPEKRKNAFIHVKKAPTMKEEDEIKEEETKFTQYWNSFVAFVSKSSLCIFHKDMKFRQIVKEIIEHTIFNYFIAVVIVGNCVTLCLDTPLNDPDGILILVLNYFNYFFSTIFLIEAVLKIIAYGFLFRAKEEFNFTSSSNTNNFLKEADNFLKNKRIGTVELSNLNNEEKINLVKKSIKKLEKDSAYLREASNIIDFFVVIIGCIDMMGIKSIRYLRTLRALRSVRPIRILTKNDNLKMIVTCLIKSIPAMANVLLVCAIFIFIYALLGIDLFKKEMTYYCSLPDYITQEDCLSKGGFWLFNFENFSNFLYALKTLFNLMMAQGWGDVMNISAQSMQTKWTYLYFVSYLIIGYIFILNLFVSIIVQKFKILRNKENHFSQLSEEEREWIKVQKIMLKFRPVPKFKVEEDSRIKKKLLDFVVSKRFENITVICILLSMITLVMQYNNSSDTYNYILDAGNYLFTFIFNIEMILKIFVYGKIFFYTGWNIFDLSVIILCDLMVIINGLTYANVLQVKNLSSLPIILRTFRFLRVIRLLTVYSKLRALIDTLVYLVPSIFNIGIVLFIVILIYGCIGMNLFGTVPYREHIHHNNNFRNFLSSALVLFRVTTGEDWNYIMNEVAFHDCRNLTSLDAQRDYYCINYNLTCIDDEFLNFTSIQDGNYSCGTDLSFLYFISFVIIGPIFILNLCVVTVIDGFSESMYENEGLLTQDYMDRFVSVWLNYDPNCRKLIRPHEFVLILKELHPPIGFNYDRHYIFNPMTMYFHRKKCLVLRKFIKSQQEKSSNNYEIDYDCFKDFSDYKHLENAHEFKNFYLSLNQKFYTTDLEVLKLTDKFKFTAIEQKIEDTNSYSYTFTNKSIIKKENTPINNTAGIEHDKGLYIHFVDACLGLSRLIVSQKNNISYEKLRESVVGTFTKKMWISQYTEDNLDKYFSNIAQKDKLSERLGIRIVAKVKKILVDKLKSIREKIAARNQLKKEEEGINNNDDDVAYINVSANAKDLLHDQILKKQTSSLDLSLNRSQNSSCIKDQKNMTLISRRNSRSFVQEIPVKSLSNSRRTSFVGMVTTLFQDDKEKVQKFDKEFNKTFQDDLFYRVEEVYENVENDAQIPDFDEELEDIFNTGKWV